MAERPEQDLERYVTALAERLRAGQTPLTTPASPSTARPSRRGRLVMAAATAAAIVIAVAVLRPAGDGSPDSPLTGTTTTTTAVQPTTQVAVSWEPVPGTDLEIRETSPAVVWTGEVFVVLYTENLGADRGPRGATVGTEGHASELPPAPIGWRGAPTVAWTGTEVLVVGGTTGLEREPLGAAYAPATGEWRPIDLPDELAATLDRAPLDAGVWTSRGLVFWDEGVAYDPESDTWTRTEPAPLAPRSGAAVTAIGDDIIVWGGAEERPRGRADPPEPWIGDGAHYRAATGTWEMLPQAPLAPGPFATAVPDGEGGVVVMSMQVADLPEGVGSSEGAVLARYRPDRGWEALPDPAAAPRYGSALAVVDGHVVVVGPTDDGTQAIALAPGGTRWQDVAEPAVTRSFAALEAAGGRLLLAGGDPAAAPELGSVDIR